MRAFEEYQGQPTTKAALQLSALLFQRPGNIRSMEWAWIDFEQSMLTIPSMSMKRTKAHKLNGRPHFVPLAPQATAILHTSPIPVNLAVGTGKDCSELYVSDFRGMYLLLRQAFASTGEIGFACHVRADVVIPHPQTFAVVKGHARISTSAQMKQSPAWLAQRGFDL